MKIKAVY